MINRIGVLGALFVILAREAVIVRDTAKECLCTKHIFWAHSTCNLALRRALGHDDVSACIDGKHYQLNDKGEIIKGSGCPCNTSIWDWVTETHLGLRCAVDDHCWYLCLLLASLFVLSGLVITLPIDKARVIITAAAGARMSKDITLTWSFDWSTFFVLSLAHFGDLPANILGAFGRFFSRGINPVSANYAAIDDRADYLPLIAPEPRRTTNGYRDKRGRYRRS